MIMKRIVSGILGMLALLAGAFACLYAISATNGYLSSQLTVWSAIVSWCITLITLVYALRFVRFSLFQAEPRVRTFLDSLLIGLSCFFPGFVVTALLSGRWIETLWVLRASLSVGLLSALIGSIVYLGRRREQMN
jgi:hypothetical protein